MELVKLLTPQDVADILQISIKTVYQHASRLGGFYPAGIRVLRFRESVIESIVNDNTSEPKMPITRKQTAIATKRKDPMDPNRHGLLGKLRKR